MSTPTATVSNGVENRVGDKLGQAKVKIGLADRLYGMARQGGNCKIPVVRQTDKGQVTVELPTPATLTPEAAKTEAQSNGFSFSLPTKGSLLGKAVCKDAKGKLKGDLASEFLEDFMNGE